MVTLYGGTSTSSDLLNKMNPDVEEIHRLVKSLRQKQELIFDLLCWVGDGEDFLERHFKVALSPPRPKSRSDHVPTDSELARARETEREVLFPLLLLLLLLHFFRLSRSFADLDSEAAAMREKETLAASHTQAAVALRHRHQDFF